MQNGFVCLIGKLHVLELDIAVRSAPRVMVRLGSSSSSFSARISLVRSRPAMASVSCVPTFDHLEHRRRP